MDKPKKSRKKKKGMKRSTENQESDHINKIAKHEIWSIKMIFDGMTRSLDPKIHRK